MAVAVVHKKEEMIIRLNDFASILDAEMTAIRVALENARETRDKIAIHTYSLTAVSILHNRKLDLNAITRAIRDAASRFKKIGQLFTDYPPILKYRVTRIKARLQRGAYNLI